MTNKLTLVQIKLYMGPVNKNPKKTNQNLDFLEYAKLNFCEKKIASAKKMITLLCISKEAARVDFRTENQIKNF